MTAGKNPRNFKKKGAKKKTAHPFAKKEWYNVLAPGFEKRNITLTPCNKTIGNKLSAENLQGRVFQISQADCDNNAEDVAWRKLKFQVQEIKGFDCYTNFYGMDITKDKACQMVKKWYSLIEAFVQAKTNDGYIIRMFCIAFTNKTKKQVKATCYAKASHQKLIRKKMMEIMQSQIQQSSLKDLVKKLVKEEIGQKIQKDASKIFPLQNNCMIRKVKILKQPKFDLTKLMELYKVAPTSSEAKPAAAAQNKLEE